MARLSSAVSFSRLRTSRSSSTRLDADGDRPRQAQIHERLRRQAPRAARLEQDALDRPAAAGPAASPPMACRSRAARSRRSRSRSRARRRSPSRGTCAGDRSAAAACVGQAVRILPERQVRIAGDRADLRAGGRHTARRLQPGRTRERVRTERLPAVRPAFFGGEHEPVVGQRVIRRVGQQESPVGGRVRRARTRARCDRPAATRVSSR